MRVLALAMMLMVQDVGDLIQQLDDRDPEARAKAEAELVKRGPEALPALEKSKSARAEAVAHRIRWNDMEIVPPAGEIREALRSTLASGEMTGEGGMPLDTVFAEVTGALEEAKLPWADDRSCDVPWSYLDPAAFTRTYRSWTKDDKLARYRMGGDKAVLHVTSSERVPRFFALRGAFDLAKATWDEKAHAIPALGAIANGRCWAGLHLASRTACKSYVLFTFCWDQDKPSPNLRHVLVTESFVVFAIGYQ